MGTPEQMHRYHRGRLITLMAGLAASRMSSSSAMVIVDCGSGYTRASRFHRSPTNRVHATATRCNIRALHHVMSCPCESSEWLRQLAELVDEVDAGATEVVLGATGGVRDLVSSGGITPEELTRFRELLATSADLPFTARLHILGGDDEARYEFLSAKYCATQCDYFSPTGDIVGRSDLNLGLLSSGGMSSQLFAKGCSLSVPTEIKKANRLGLEHGMEKGLAQVRQHASSVIEHRPGKVWWEKCPLCGDRDVWRGGTEGRNKRQHRGCVVGGRRDRETVRFHREGDRGRLHARVRADLEDVQ